MYKTITVAEEAMAGLSKKDVRLASYIKATGPISREGINDPFIAILDCIIAQQVSTKAAQSISNRFFSRFSTCDAAEIVAADVTELRSLGLSGPKVNYIQGIARAKVENSVDFDRLRQHSTQEIMDILLPLKGVGRWTVEMLLIFTFEKSDVMSYDDLAIRRGIQRIYHKDECTKEFLAKIYKRLKPYQSAASFYFWHASQSATNIPYKKEE